MSVRVDLASLRAEIARLGASALVITISPDDGPPHVSSVLVTVEDDNLSMSVGRKTRANIAEHPAVSLVWAGGRDDEYCLIVDGAAREGPAETLLVLPKSAVLHRVASAPTEIAQCLPVDGSITAGEGPR